MAKVRSHLDKVIYYLLFTDGQNEQDFYSLITTLKSPPFSHNKNAIMSNQYYVYSKSLYQDILRKKEILDYFGVGYSVDRRYSIVKLEYNNNFINIADY